MNRAFPARSRPLNTPSMSDLRYALRVLLRTPGLTAVAILSLALGIGANVTIYTIANAFLDQPIAGAHDVDRLVRIYRGDHSPLQYADLARVRAEKGVFSDVAGERMTAVAVTIGADIHRVQASLVTDGYFRMLAVQPELGRFFAQSDSIDTAPVIVISHAFWRDHLGADPAAVGHTLNVNDRLFTIVGVAPAQFTSSMFLWRVDLWLPPSAAEMLLGVPFSKWGGSLYTTARLAPRATMSGAQASVATVASQLRTEDPLGHQGFRFRVDGARGIHAELRGPTVVASGFLMVVVGMVLLIACANVANLLLARGTARQRELAVRFLLGATRAQILRQLITESLVIALLGGIAGLGVGYLGILFLQQLHFPSDIVTMPAFQMDSRALQPYLARRLPFDAAVQRALPPVRRFMLRQTRENDLSLFIKTQVKVG